jgi:uncharacterized protein YbbK (DUF523 family)
MKIGISSCLAGIKCTYSGSDNLIKGFDRFIDDFDGQIIMACPEVLGGLSTPRAPAEIQNQDPLLIQNNQGRDVTNEYIKGATKALQIFLDHQVEVALLKFRSPSCGNDSIYDGHFTHTLINGQGVFAKMLEDNGIKVFNEKQILEFLKYIGKEDVYGAYFKD